MENRKGSKRYPLKLTHDKRPRPLLEKHAGKNFEFSNEPSTGEDCFLRNIVGNEFLSKMAIRIAIYLHEHFRNRGEFGEYDYYDDFALAHGSMFLTCSDESKLTTLIYDDTLQFYVIHNGKKDNYDMPFPNLVSLLCESGIQISSSNLNKALVELHNFHYITLTPEPTSKQQLLNNKRVRKSWRHIRLYKGMYDKYIFHKLRT